VCHLESWLRMHFTPRLSRRSPPALAEGCGMNKGVGGFLGPNHIRICVGENLKYGISPRQGRWRHKLNSYKLKTVSFFIGTAILGRSPSGNVMSLTNPPKLVSACHPSTHVTGLRRDKRRRKSIPDPGVKGLSPLPPEAFFMQPYNPSRAAAFSPKIFCLRALSATWPSTSLM